MPTKNFNGRKNIKLYTDEPQKISMLTSILIVIILLLFDNLFNIYFGPIINNCVKKIVLTILMSI